MENQQYITPEVKMLLRFKKEWLVVKAKELCISTEGSKQILAIRIAKKQEQEMSRTWRAIAQ